jgi:hypothetical protein
MMCQSFFVFYDLGAQTILTTTNSVDPATSLQNTMHTQQKTTRQSSGKVFATKLSLQIFTKQKAMIPDPKF